jgi:hypothetical protein
MYVAVRWFFAAVESLSVRVMTPVSIAPAEFGPR